MHKICIIDYGSGNVQSIASSLKILNINSVISKKNSDINDSTHLILPGVGSYKSTMTKLKKNIDIVNLENEVLIKRKPMLGICVGMQIFSNYGYEFEKVEGLGWIPGEVKKIETYMILPHIGWNSVEVIVDNVLINKKTTNEFYFLHSYYFNCKNIDKIIGITNYDKKFPTIINQNNIFGVQFHPEKSQSDGLKLIKNFSNFKSC